MYPSDQLCEENGVLDVCQLSFRNLALNQFKNKEISKFVQHGHFTRQRETQLIVPRVYKTIGQRCHSYLAPLIYNALPTDLRSINSFNLFKKRLNIWIRQKTRAEISSLIDIKNN